MRNEPPVVSPPTIASLDCYFAGELSAGEAAQVAAWLANPAAAAYADALRHVWPTSSTPVDVDAAWTTMTTRRLSRSAISSRPPIRTFVPSPRVSTLIGALAIAVVFLAFGVIYRGSLAPAKTNVINTSRTYVTHVGQRVTVILGDGSQVHLAPESRLRLATGYGGHSRTVTLQGEAYFLVPHAGDVPFIVHTATTSMRVLGTAFDVRHYPGDPATRIAVLTGRVAVQPGTMTPGRSATVVAANMTGIATDSTMMVREGTADATGWITGQLVFRDAPLPDMLATLTRWYGYQFRLADSSLAHHTLTLGLSTESSQDALTTLGRILDVDVVVDGTIVTLRPRRAGASHAGPRTEHRLQNTLPYTEVGR